MFVSLSALCTETKLKIPTYTFFSFWYKKKIEIVIPFIKKKYKSFFSLFVVQKKRELKLQNLCRRVFVKVFGGASFRFFFRFLYKKKYKFCDLFNFLISSYLFLPFTLSKLMLNKTLFPLFWYLFLYITRFIILFFIF